MSSTVAAYAVGGVVTVSAFTIIMLSLRITGLHERLAKVTLSNAEKQAALNKLGENYERALEEFGQRELRTESLVSELRRRTEYWRDQLEKCGTEADRGRVARDALRHMLTASERVEAATRIDSTRLPTSLHGRPGSGS